MLQIDQQEDQVVAVRAALTTERQDLIEQSEGLRAQRQEAESIREHHEAELNRITDEVTMVADNMKEEWQNQQIMQKLKDIEEDNRKLQDILAQQSGDQNTSGIRKLGLLESPKPASIAEESESEEPQPRRRISTEPSNSAILRPKKEKQAPVDDRPLSSTSFERNWKRNTAGDQLRSSQFLIDASQESLNVFEDEKVKSILDSKGNIDQALRDAEEEKKRQSRAGMILHPERLTIREKRDRFEKSMRQKAEAAALSSSTHSLRRIDGSHHREGSISSLNRSDGSNSSLDKLSQSDTEQSTSAN